MMRLVLPALAAVLLFSAVINLGMVAQLSDDEVFLGYTQRDQILYHAFAREIFEGGNGLLCANPYGLDSDTPVIYSHLGIVLAGHLWRIGLPFPLIDQAFRIAFGTAMFALWALLVRRFFREPDMRFAATALGWTGGGVAWLWAMGSVAANGGDLWPAFLRAESSYAWWFANLWRNQMFAMECLHHALAFATFLALLRRRWGWASLLLGLTWWSHPYTGLEVGLITGLFLSLGVILRRGRAGWAPLLVTTAISLAFVVHDGWWLNRFEGHRGIMERQALFEADFDPAMVIPAWGPLLLLSLPWVVSARGRRWVVVTSTGRLWLAWLLGAAGLVLHQYLPLIERPLQPMHFTRGYVFLPLVITGLMGLRQVWRRLQPDRRPVVSLALLTLLLLPDNLLFLVRYLQTDARESGVCVIPRDDWEAIEHLRTVEETQRIAVLQKDVLWGLDYLIPTFTHHRSALGHVGSSPGVVDRAHALGRAHSTGDLAELHDLGVEMILVRPSDFADGSLDWLVRWRGRGWELLSVP